MSKSQTTLKIDVKQVLTGKKNLSEVMTWSNLSFTLFVTHLLPEIEGLNLSETEFRLERIVEIVFIFIITIIPNYRC